MDLLKHAKNVHSQFGEDGILEQILLALPERNHWCAEFGAWDGKLLSNTYRLIDEQGYAAVLIEADPAKFAVLKDNMRHYPEVVPIRCFVGLESNTLDEIFSKTQIPTSFDFLSIDIDSCDYHVWESLQKYHPKVVCIEYNPTVPNGVRYVQPPSFAHASGASLESINDLAISKGYELVAATRNNGIFVLAELRPLFHEKRMSPAELRQDDAWVSTLISGYDGELIVLGHNMIPWNGVRIDRMIHQLPKPVRVFPEGASLWRRKALGAWKKLRRLA